MLSPDRRQNSVTHIYNTLRQAIVAGELLEGSQLKQAEIGRNHGVSKIPVREALTMLEADGFVTIQAGRGARVAELSWEEAQEIYLMRMALEPILLRDSVPQLETLTFAKADAILHTIEISEQLTSHDWHQLDREFHSLLYKGAPHIRMQHIVGTLHDNLSRYFSFFSELGIPFRQESNAEHRKILELSRAKDVVTACEVLTGSMETGLASLRKKLEERTES